MLNVLGGFMASPSVNIYYGQRQKLSEISYLRIDAEIPEWYNH